MWQKSTQFRNDKGNKREKNKIRKKKLQQNEHMTLNFLSKNCSS